MCICVQPCLLGINYDANNVEAATGSIKSAMVQPVLILTTCCPHYIIRIGTEWQDPLHTQGKEDSDKPVGITLSMDDVVLRNLSGLRILWLWVCVAMTLNAHICVFHSVDVSPCTELWVVIDSVLSVYFRYLWGRWMVFMMFDDCDRVSLDDISYSPSLCLSSLSAARWCCWLIMLLCDSVFIPTSYMIYLGCITFMMTLVSAWWSWITHEQMYATWAPCSDKLCNIWYDEQDIKCHRWMMVIPLDVEWCDNKDGEDSMVISSIFMKIGWE